MKIYVSSFLLNVFCKQIPLLKVTGFFFRLAEDEEDLNKICATIDEDADFNFMFGPSFTKEHARKIYENRIKKGSLLWVVEDKETAEYIGYAGISDRFLGQESAAKFYIAIDPTKRKKGYGLEIEKRILDYIKVQKKHSFFLHSCILSNVGSIKIGRKTRFNVLRN
jgi:RimJ/RimL family protein N-acetyltransferase